MASFGSGANRTLAGRGPAVGFRFTVYAILSIVLMFYDQRGGWLDTARYGLQAAAYPLQLAINSPSAAWNWIRESVATRETLQQENARLRKLLREQQLRTMRFDSLERENVALRGLTDKLPPLIERQLIGEVISIELSALRQRLLINRGARNGVTKALPVMAGDGVVGQTLRVGPWSAEIILISDAEHALPVQVLRSGVRTIAVGTGRTATLNLPYVPLNADIKVGDLLVTSGLGGVFPHGLPVAKVTSVERDSSQPLAQITAGPLARVEQDREVMFVWPRAGHPAAPGTDKSTGTETLQPQATTVSSVSGAASANSASADLDAPVASANAAPATVPSAAGSAAPSVAPSVTPLSAPAPTAAEPRP